MDPNIVTAETNPFFAKQVEVKPVSHKIVNFLQGMVVLAFFLIVVYLFVVTPNQIDGRSMLPNFVNDDLVLTNRLAQWFDGTALGNAMGLTYQRGDVVVVSTAGIIPGEDYVIKRIVALPGDIVGVKDGDVFLNGSLLDESSYLPAGRRSDHGTFLGNGDQLTVPEGKVAIFGDNRPESLDSRNLPIGFIEKKRLIGKVIFRFWPPERITTIGRAQDTSSEYSRDL
jgi:signal peptidase I